MKPILYSINETEFISNGIGILSDVLECECTEVLNGMYELQLKIGNTSLHAHDILNDCVLKVRPNYLDNPQLFRVYSVEKKYDGIITVKAAHISYDTSGIPIKPFSSGNLDDAVSHMNSDRILISNSKFLLSNNFSAQGSLVIDSPKSFRSILGGSDNSITGVYGGEYHYDNFTINLLYRRGVDKGVCFRFGKNITGFEYNSSSEKLFTAVVGYWKKSGNKENNEPDTIIYGNVIECEGQFPYDKIDVLDTSSKIKNDNDAVATVEQIDEQVRLHIAQNAVGIPKTGMKIDYVDDINVTAIGIGDSMGIIFPEYKIRGTARCTKCVYDCILERNKSIEIGEVVLGISNTIANLDKK